MARLTIEECWWTDARRSALIRLLGTEGAADACAIRAWRQAQDFWKNDKQLVPKALFDLLEGSELLIKVGLAEVREDTVYVRGSSAYLEWLNERRAAARRGGKKSAQRPRDTAGKLKKASQSIQANAKQTPSKPQPNANQTQASSSYSSSSSYSVIPFPSETGVALARQAPDDRNPVSLWVKAYRDKYGVRYAFQKKDFGILKGFGSQYGPDQVEVLFACYLAIDEKFYADAKHPLSLFFRDLQKISVAAQTGIEPSKAPAFDYSKLKD